MCGIFGIVSREPVAERLCVGAQGLRNRGEQSTKIITYDTATRLFYKHGGLGDAQDVFKGYDLANIKGNRGSAHTRYATAGDPTERNMQPVFSARPGMYTCSNGDILNICSQRQFLEYDGYFFNKEVDASVLSATLAKQMIDRRVHKVGSMDEYANALFAAVQDVQKELIGAYSTIVILPRGMLAFKDPNGIRPLCIAHRTVNGKVVERAAASESGVFNDLRDYNDITELEPGEAIFVDENMKVYRLPGNPEHQAFCFFEYTYFARPDTQFFGKRVAMVREQLGTCLAHECRELASQFDCVAAVPATAVDAGHAFARELGLPYANALLRRHKAMRSFQQFRQSDREKVADGKIMFIKERIEGKKLIVVDDSNVRGTTARRHDNTLHDYRVKALARVFYTPRIIAPCYYGIDTPDPNELIAVGRTDAEIAKHIDADIVKYMSLDGLIKGLGLPADKFCTACVTGKYPTSIDGAKDRRVVRQAERKLERNIP